MNTPESNEYIRDILSQPEALARTLESVAAASPARELAGRASGRVVLTGMGASLHCLVPLFYALAGRGRDVHLVETSELVHSLFGFLIPGTTVVAVSQSGRSAEIVALLGALPPGVLVLGVTNDAHGDLAAEADAVVLTVAGHEHSVSSKTYTTALLALAWLAPGFLGADALKPASGLETAAGVVAHYLSRWDERVDEMTVLLEGVAHVTLVGRGASLAAVGMGALIVREAAHTPATGMSSAAYRHGPIDMASPDEYVLAYAGDAQSRPLVERLVADVIRFGGIAGLVDAGDTTGPFTIPPSTPAVSPIAEILPAQLLSVALANRAGRRAGEFSHIGKVTTVE